MSKIRLDLDALDVQSFTTEEGKKERGTVLGHLCSDSTCNQDICTCTDAYGNCYATNVACSGGDPYTSTTAAGTRVQTCATGSQDICYC
jgi:hypothetical protein